MTSYLSALFIRDKILQLQSALFFNCSNSVLKIPNQVINALYADELGQVWFCIPPPFQSMYEFDKAFPAQLDFFKKEADFFLKITGKAFVVNDPEELNNLAIVPEDIKQRIRNGKIVLMKLHIQNAEYFEKNIPEPEYSLPKIKNQFYKWFSHQQTGNYEAASKKISLQNLVHLPNIFSN
jgi:hypothetical protein